MKNLCKEKEFLMEKLKLYRFSHTSTNTNITILIDNIEGMLQRMKKINKIIMNKNKAQPLIKNIEQGE